MSKIEVIAFDADDTLWANQPFFDETEKRFNELMADYMPKEQIAKELLKIQEHNIKIYGYGAKGHALSMTEAALKISDNKVSPLAIREILDMGKELLSYPVELLDGVEETLDALAGKYKLVVATKGDPVDQEAKIKRSGIAGYFEHVEVMTDKKPTNYVQLLNNIECNSDTFMMIGNSIKSDILPVIEVGGKAVHVPFYSTWEHERVDNVDESLFISVPVINDVIPFLTR